MQNKPNNDLLKYAGLATQFLVSIGAMVFVGLKTDKWLGLKFPLLVWLLPLLTIVVLIWKIYKDTTPKNNQH